VIEARFDFGQELVELAVALPGRGVMVEMEHYRFNPITLEGEKCIGKHCIRGPRMPVASVLS
jgi:hypothetical protein